MPTKGNTKFSEEYLASVIARYDTLKDFMREQQSMYVMLKRRGLYEKMCGHLKRQEPKPYTYDELKAIALRYNDLAIFHKTEKKAYCAMQRRGLLDELCAHMKRKRRPLDDKGLIKLASKYDNLKDFYLKENAAYKEVKKRGLFDKACGHMKRVLEPSYTNEDLAEVASRYTVLNEFRKKEKRAYKEIHRRGLFEQLCGNMKRGWRGEYTDEEFEEIASQYTSLTEFIKKEKYVYAAMHRRGVVDKYCGHMERTMRKPLSKKDLQNIAHKYKTRKEFRENDESAYVIAGRRGILNNICRHMKSDKALSGSYTKEYCASVASLFDTKKDFRTKCKFVYQAALSHGWIEEICGHMVQPKKSNQRKVYVFEFVDHCAYVGLTNNIARRKREHLRLIGKKKISPVLKHIQETGATYEFKELTGWIDANEAGKVEDTFINKYYVEGWEMLNSVKGGALGGYRREFPPNKIKKIVSNYVYAEDFREHEHELYIYLCGNKLYSKYCSELKHKRKGRNYWSLERSIAVIPECEDLTIFQKRYYQAYVIVKKAGLLYKYFKPKEVQHYKWPLEKCIEMARLCSSRKELHTRYAQAYKVLLKAGLLEKLIPSNKYWEKYDDEEKMKIISQCKSKRKLHDQYRQVYEWLRLNNRLDEFYPRRLLNKSTSVQSRS